MAFQRCYSLKSITVPKSIATVGDSAFFDCTGLTNAIISDGVANIGSDAFKNCYALAHLRIPNSLTNIANYALDSCQSLRSITLGTNVSQIGEYAFANSALTNIVFPSSVVSIGDHAFDYCFDLQGIFFCGDVPPYAGSSVFSWGPENPVFYLPNASGWGFWFAGRPTALWLPKIEPNEVNSRIQTGQLNFNVNWASGQTVVVEASTNFINWQPVQTFMLTNSSTYFSDTQWTNYPSRFYRLRSP